MTAPADFDDPVVREMRVRAGLLEGLIGGCVGTSHGRAHRRASNAMALRRELQRMLEIVETWLPEPEWKQYTDAHGNVYMVHRDSKPYSEGL